MVNSILTSPICTVQTIVQTERKGQIGIDLIIKLIEVIFLIVWGARGRWFESSHPDTVESIDNLMIVDAFYFSCILSKKEKMIRYVSQQLQPSLPSRLESKTFKA